MVSSKPIKLLHLLQKLRGLYSFGHCRIKETQRLWLMSRLGEGWVYNRTIQGTIKAQRLFGPDTTAALMRKHTHSHTKSHFEIL